MDEAHFSSFLLGKLSEMEARMAEHLKTLPTPPPEAPPAKPPTQAEQDAQFLASLETIAGMKPPPPAAPPPATLSRGSATFARDFAKYAEAIATGTTEVID